MSRNHLSIRNDPYISSFVFLHATRFDAICDCGGGAVIAATRDTIPGRVYRSTDYGRTYTYVTTFTGAGPLSVLCVASDLAGNVYAMLQNGDLWKSADNGATWAFKAQITTSGGPCYGVVASPTTGTLFATDGRNQPGSLWRSIDGGASFNRVLFESSGSKGLYRVIVCPWGTVIVNSFTGNIYRSYDDGISFSVVSLSSAELFGICYCENRIILCGDAEGKVFRSIDDGISWTQIAQPDGASDDMAYLGDGRVFHSTYTSGRNSYISDNYGERLRPLMRLPSGAADIVEHVAALTEPGKRPKVAFTTQQGYAGIFE